jgi:hypothetical protein
MSHGEIRSEFTGGPFRQEDILRSAFREEIAREPFASRARGRRLLAYATPLIFILVFIYFGLQAPNFFEPGSIGNILKQRPCRHRAVGSYLCS